MISGPTLSCVATVLIHAGGYCGLDIPQALFLGSFSGGVAYKFGRLCRSNLCYLVSQYFCCFFYPHPISEDKFIHKFIHVPFVPHLCIWQPLLMCVQRPLWRAEQMIALYWCGRA